MFKKLLLPLLFLLVSFPAFAQGLTPGCSNPPPNYGVVWTSSQWITCLSSFEPFLGYTPLNIAGGSMSGELQFQTSTTSNAPVTFPPGSAPSSPVNGDMWATSAGIYYQIGGVTVGPLIGSAGGAGITVGSTAITSGTNGYFLYDNSGILGNVGTTGTGNVVLATSPAVTTPSFPSGIGTPVVTATTALNQASGGSTLLPFSSTASIATGQVVAGTSITAGTTVASIVSTATTTRAANGSFNSGQKVIPMSVTTAFGVGQQCHDTTLSTVIGDGNVIFSIQAATSITMTSNIAVNSSGTTDSITCDPVVTLSATSTGTISSGASINFFANATAANLAGSGTAFVNGGLAIAGSEYIAGSLNTAGSVSGTGFSNYLASPPAIGGTVAAPGSFTTLSATGLLSTVASTTGGAGLNVPAGTAPTSPNNGDVWTTSLGIFVRINGATVGPLISSGASPVVTWNDTAQTSNFNASANTGYCVKTASGAVTVTLPTTPAAGALVELDDCNQSFATHNMTVNTGGSDTFMGTGYSIFVDNVTNFSLLLRYNLSQTNWLIVP